MWEWFSNKVMGVIILIFALIIIGFYFFPGTTHQIIGNAVNSIKPVTTGIVDTIKDLIGSFS